MRYRATLAYDGSGFQGYQRQRDGIPTVQGTVEAALCTITGNPVTVYAAGRTDTGVHATGQVIAFDVDWRHGDVALYRAINRNLPNAVAITALAPTRPDFHPRFDAVRRAYRYTLLLAEYPMPLRRHTAWVVIGERVRGFSIERLLDAAALIGGKRDYGALGTPPQGDNTVRQVFRSEWAPHPEDGAVRLEYTIEADAFLYRMVRRTVGMLYDVGRGKLDVRAVEQLLGRAEVAKGVTIAPPQGLVLTRVTYPDDE